MAATNITEIAKDGAGSAITGGVAFASESSSGAKAPVIYVKSPSTENMIEPLASTGGTVGLVAGSALIGKVGIDQTTPGTTNAVQVIATTSGNTSPSATLTVTAASAYTAGNQVGGLITFTGVVNSTPLSGSLRSILVTSKSVQTTGLKLYLFGANPTNSTWTDKTAPAINVADIPFLLGSFTLGAADSGLGTNTVWNLNDIWKSFISTTTSIYGVLVCVATPTWVATSDVTVKLGIFKD